MIPGPAGQEVFTVALRDGGDVIALRRSTQSVCRAVGLSGSPLVRLTTVVSEAGESLLGVPGLAARLCLEDAGTVVLAVRLGWRGDSRPPSRLLAAATRLLDDSGLRVAPDGGGQELRLVQRTPTPAAALEELAIELRGRLAGDDSRADLVEALRTQNHQLLAALEESQHQQEELQRLNEELEETNAGVMALYTELTSELQATNSGVVALYAELEDKTRQLELAHEYKTRFWANVSHELRSPVNSVIALARLLLDSRAESLTDEQRQQIGLVQASGSTLLALVDELLDVAKAESGRLEPQPAETDLRALLHQLRGTLRGTTQPGVALRIPDHIQRAPLVTDEVMLTRILRNVLSNALKFTVEGSVQLDITEAADERGPRFVFTVRDTGVGIPADELDRVFEEFYQVRGPHQRGRAGTGLGLPYARRLTELLKGTVTLDSVVGQGTQVVIDIPALLPAASREAASVVRSVLVVDDDETWLTGFRALLAELAGSVTVLTDSGAVVAAVERERPDVVVLDLNMPGASGYQVRRQLAASPATAQVPVIVVTALEPADVDHARLAPVRAVLNKSRLTPAILAASLGQEENTAAARRPAAQAPLPSPAEERR
ncbi:hybrid sensor histidine kinase/response regulator [Streptomyces griseofuscus]|uniref:histidine kinase n=1 Tax=Streptomyces griseofuscus TaxID=146922 RepID=A0A3R8Q6Z9_9ACTN|nr:ATP-binding protein [Streptomyces griseofuscus]RRQ77457.1 hybrid sensor histidine kinase/response regulator [Streptomyces griseofuscus]RRQ82754.1 hybrid sensor histidine kinase/response regulator [Streptomyces griseofuscus]